MKLSMCEVGSRLWFGGERGDGGEVKKKTEVISSIKG